MHKLNYIWDQALLIQVTTTKDCKTDRHWQMQLKINNAPRNCPCSEAYQLLQVQIHTYTVTFTNSNQFLASSCCCCCCCSAIFISCSCKARNYLESSADAAVFCEACRSLRSSLRCFISPRSVYRTLWCQHENVLRKTRQDVTRLAMSDICHM